MKTSFKTLKVLFALLFLVVGPSPLMAQTADPFGSVDKSKFENTMNITGYVLMAKMVNGEWASPDSVVVGNQAVVAVYCGDELRGKESPADFNDKYFSLLMLTVYGENNDKLHFKVFIPDADGEQAKGRIIEYDPDTLVFKGDTRLGKAKEPLYINLPAPITTTFLDEGWATVCLPFNAEVPEGVTLWVVTGIEDGKLVKEEVDADILPKDTPVLVNTESLTSCEWLSRVVDKETLDENISLFSAHSSILKGTNEPLEVAANSVLTFGYSDERNVGFWKSSVTEISANSAYIEDFPADSKGAAIDDTTTGISEIRGNVVIHDTAYDLQGRKAHSSVMSKGVYIINGKKHLVR